MDLETAAVLEADAKALRLAADAMAEMSGRLHDMARHHERLLAEARPSLQPRAYAKPRLSLVPKPLQFDRT